MTEQLWILLLVMAGFALYVAGKVYAAMKKSDEQWHEVDKSKLKTWDDDEE